MKKLIALMLALTIVVSFAACGGNDAEPENTDPQVTTVPEETTDVVPENTTGNNSTADVTLEELEIVDTTSALEVLDYVWIGMGAEKQPATYGGHISAEYMGGPNTYDLSYAKDLAATLLLPEDQMDSVSDAATVVHFMNANIMTAGVLKLKEGTDVQAFAEAVSQRISNNQWVCGFPEKMAVIQIHDNFLFVSFGTAELVDGLVGGISENWAVNELYNQPLA